jgi:hypothetical protein
MRQWDACANFAKLHAYFVSFTEKDESNCKQPGQVAINAER